MQRGSADVRRTLRPARRLGAVGAAAGRRTSTSRCCRPSTRPVAGHPTSCSPTSTVPTSPSTTSSTPWPRSTTTRSRRSSPGSGTSGPFPRSPAGCWTDLGRSGRCSRSSCGRTGTPSSPRTGRASEAPSRRTSPTAPAQTLRGGLFDLLADLHHEVSVDGAVLRIDKPHHEDVTYQGARLTLVPAVFIWPHLLLAHSTPGAFQLTYPARGVGRLWEGIAGERTPRDDLGTAARPHPRHRPDQPGCADVDHVAVARARSEPGDDQPAPRRPARVRHGAVVAVRPVGALPADRPGGVARRCGDPPPLGGQVTKRDRFGDRTTPTTPDRRAGALRSGA